nr:PREDICTED: endonuclease domain-containing 1 protein [Anolis carolinensis]|eukprot:XP_008110434.1 PREDICTED: endonuclease domain-containing 1 protein [Anolis carolinensis]
MMTPSKSKIALDKLEEKQALSTDYEDTDYDRGHLNPNAFQCGDGRKATFTLTNAAPMDPCFNRIYWYKNEKDLKARLKNECANKRGTAFLVTGTVPDNNKRIPDPDKDKESDNPKREFSRVSVPTHIWTAVCCHFESPGKPWSSAVLAKNEPQSVIQKLSVHDLQDKLKELYNLSNLKIFADDNSCNGNTMAHLITSMEEMALEDKTGNEPPEKYYTEL